MKIERCSLSENKNLSKFIWQLFRPSRVIAILYLFISIWWYLNSQNGPQHDAPAETMISLIPDMPLVILLFLPLPMGKLFRRVVFCYLCVYPVISIATRILDPGRGGYYGGGQIAATKLQLRNIANAIALFQEDCGRLPQTLDELVIKPSDCPHWGPKPYSSHLPKDAWNHPFVYTPKGNLFEIKSLGADGKEGGVGYDRDITLNDAQ